MIVELLDSNFNALGYDVPFYELQITKKLYEPDEFTLYMPSIYGVNYTNVWAVLLIRDSVYEHYIVYKIIQEETAEGIVVTISGYEATKMLNLLNFRKPLQITDSNFSSFCEPVTSGLYSGVCHFQTKMNGTSYYADPPFYRVYVRVDGNTTAPTDIDTTAEIGTNYGDILYEIIEPYHYRLTTRPSIYEDAGSGTKKLILNSKIEEGTEWSTIITTEDGTANKITKTLDYSATPALVIGKTDLHLLSDSSLASYWCGSQSVKPDDTQTDTEWYAFSKYGGNYSAQVPSKYLGDVEMIDYDKIYDGTTQYLSHQLADGRGILSTVKRTWKQYKTDRKSIEVELNPEILQEKYNHSLKVGDSVLVHVFGTTSRFRVTEITETYQDGNYDYSCNMEAV